MLFKYSVGLLEAFQRNIGTLTAAKCGQWYRFMPMYIPRYLNGENFAAWKKFDKFYMKFLLCLLKKLFVVNELDIYSIVSF